MDFMVSVLARILFCYNTYMKNRVSASLFLLGFFLFFLPQNSSGQQDIGHLISEIQDLLRKGDIPGYLSKFSPEIRKEEEDRINYLFDQLQMEDVTLYGAQKANTSDEEPDIFLQALYENSYFVVIETWQLLLHKKEDQWQIKEKKISGEVKEVYKIQIPSMRIERVKSIEIEHVDIKLIFRDAILFYDNIPELETALLIIGKGELSFHPSDPGERHQLELLYNKKYFEDSLEYAYLRFSDSFFRENIKIHPRTDEKRFLASSAERNKASAIFREHYPRSFTIENSLTGALLSFLPRGGETVFEFDGDKFGKFSYIYSPFADEEVYLYQWKNDKIISLYSPGKSEGTRRLFFSFGQMFNIERYQIDVAFDPKKVYLSGKAKIDILPQVESLDGVRFKLNSELEILRIFDQEKRELFYTQDKLRNIVYIYFFQPPPMGRSSSIEIFYRGKLIPPKQVTDVVAEPQFSETSAYTPSRFDSFLYSQSAYWYPAPANNDYFKARLKIIVPSDYTCIATGNMIEKSKLNSIEKVEEIEKMGNSVYVYETEYPVKYISFLVGKFSKVQEDSSGLPLKFYKSSTGIRVSHRQFLEEAKDIVRFYERVFGPFPYEKLTIVQRVWSVRGGHSSPSFIVINEIPQIPGRKDRFLNSKCPVDFSRWEEYFLAHEIAHQWWGQGVTWKTYHDQWLSEGLAQFSSILYLSEKHGEKVLDFIIRELSYWTEKKTEWGAITMGSRLSYFDFEAFQSIIYNKASLVLFLLKDIIGEEVFFQGLREFFARHKYGAASTNDFVKTFNHVSGTNLEPFFECWFDTHILPDVKVSHTILRQGEGYLLRLNLTQKGHLFVFPLLVGWDQDGRNVTKKLLIDEKEERFEFELEGKPRKIKININKAVPGEFD
jgi:hypothetical protein